MVTVEELRKALGESGRGLSDDELQHINTLLARLAGVIFDDWMKQPSKSTEDVPSSQKM